jgi:hypothetical protein
MDVGLTIDIAGVTSIAIAVDSSYGCIHQLLQLIAAVFQLCHLVDVTGYNAKRDITLTNSLSPQQDVLSAQSRKLLGS